MLFYTHKMTVLGLPAAGSDGIHGAYASYSTTKTDANVFHEQINSLKQM